MYLIVCAKHMCLIVDCVFSGDNAKVYETLFQRWIVIDHVYKPLIQQQPKVNKVHPIIAQTLHMGNKVPTTTFVSLRFSCFLSLVFSLLFSLPFSSFFVANSMKVTMRINLLKERRKQNVTISVASIKQFSLELYIVVAALWLLKNKTSMASAFRIARSLILRH
jgi:hypothetical protein